MEVRQGRRRYLAIQSAPQQGRRPRGKVEVVPTIESGNSPPPSDRSMTGFMLLEHDLANGTILWACSMPWVLSGESNFLSGPGTNNLTHLVHQVLHSTRRPSLGASPSSVRRPIYFTRTASVRRRDSARTRRSSTSGFYRPFSRRASGRRISRSEVTGLRPTLLSRSRTSPSTRSHRNATSSSRSSVSPETL